ncbi:gluconate 2-dehydrogenase subunit 3 family protein [Sediminibacterium goheungense]|uniref:Gluconate 2-dehydrogenase subunit 3-like protein n=1 Tax=Sediminibacterium goheungense TaxID=1086393 RepID=A0A4R6J3A6_9BACT|nr:gluconate 2-dehydrogenase subunit 3 family protein [Sediminibacterium goheungense]TDO28655.1 gluconate 2-dehydrogenase subunit 3-like protein [Sediminibacterium goheungense]
MDRRKSIKALVVGTVATGVLVDACKPADKKETANTIDGINVEDRMAEEKAYLEKLSKEAKFFSQHEMSTITILADIIVPKDAVSGSASDAKVPEFLEFIVKDMPSHQTPMRGGLRWLDMQCLKQFEKSFVDCTEQQRIQMVDQIAYPEKAKPEMAQGVAFFNLMRDLTLTGFYTSEIGVKDLDYRGNVPNKWNGVPEDVLKQYKMAYSEREMKECASYT